MRSFRVGVRANYNLCLLKSDEPSTSTASTCGTTCTNSAPSYGCDVNGLVVTYPAGVGACSTASTSTCKCYQCNTSTYTCSPAPANASQSLTGLYSDLNTCSTSCKPPSYVVSFQAKSLTQSQTSSSGSFLLQSLVLSQPMTSITCSATTLRYNFDISSSSQVTVNFYLQLRNTTTSSTQNWYFSTNNFSSASALASASLLTTLFTLQGLTNQVIEWRLTWSVSNSTPITVYNPTLNAFNATVKT